MQPPKHGVLLAFPHHGFLQPIAQLAVLVVLCVDLLVPLLKVLLHKAPARPLPPRPARLAPPPSLPIGRTGTRLGQVVENIVGQTKLGGVHIGDLAEEEEHHHPCGHVGPRLVLLGPVHPRQQPRHLAVRHQPSSPEADSPRVVVQFELLTRLPAVGEGQVQRHAPDSTPTAVLKFEEEWVRRRQRQDLRRRPPLRAEQLSVLRRQSEPDPQVALSLAGILDQSSHADRGRSCRVVAQRDVLNGAVAVLDVRDEVHVERRVLELRRGEHNAAAGGACGALSGTLAHALERTLQPVAVDVVHVAQLRCHRLHGVVGQLFGDLFTDAGDDEERVRRMPIRPLKQGQQRLVLLVVQVAPVGQ
mmetsp:Transcript_27913/g.90213  ORF Transcript_27913/g.90213 Transcript_27913/m.90213 type:complete len:359 (-) Transcript_27913:231-1307(-)